MSESAYAASGEDFGSLAEDDEFKSDLPERPRRRFLNQWSAALVALVVGAIGFYVGVRVEKGNVSSSGTGSGAAATFASRTADTGGTTKTGGSKTSKTGSSTSSFASRFTGGFAGTAGGGTTGTVSSIDGNTLYVKETSGNTVKVKLSSSTAITKTESVSKRKVNPGDTVAIDGVTGSGGVLTATSLTDSGDSSTSTASSSAGVTSAGATATSSRAAVISSLFGGG